jgi:hypothetical protein
MALALMVHIFTFIYSSAKMNGKMNANTDRVGKKSTSISVSRSLE